MTELILHAMPFIGSFIMVYKAIVGKVRGRQLTWYGRLYLFRGACIGIVSDCSLLGILVGWLIRIYHTQRLFIKTFTRPFLKPEAADVEAQTAQALAVAATIQANQVQAQQIALAEQQAVQTQVTLQQQAMQAQIPPEPPSQKQETAPEESPSASSPTINTIPSRRPIQNATTPRPGFGIITSRKPTTSPSLSEDFKKQQAEKTIVGSKQKELLKNRLEDKVMGKIEDTSKH